MLYISQDGFGILVDDISINGYSIKKALNDKISRKDIIGHLGEPIYSDLGIKYFDIYKYKVGERTYQLNINYTKNGKDFFIDGYQVYKSNPRIFILGYVLLH